MTILVTGTSGHLGRLVVESLLERGVPAAEIVATARDTDAVADLADRGVVTRRADYTDPASLKEAFAGVDKAILVSSNQVGERVAQHRNVVDAAADAGVALLAYTSVLKGERSTLLLAAEHVETERYLAESGLPVALLRNGWYVENWTAHAPAALEHGAVLGAVGEGRVSAATRADFAAAAAAVLTRDDQAGTVHELGGTPFTLAEYAATLSEVSGRDVVYRDLPVEDFTAVLVGAGLPEPVAAVYADGDRGIRDGDLLAEGDDLSRLIGRPSTPLVDAVRAALA
jgi:NAD(P)H dehydrogenase (quinone)